ncbi:hypothetical protein HYU14_03560 [Candidatus Woesearchaeota archaeon]|nr:hypothetical protein [Candidatus Woesearchaeota archaeon]
MDLEEKRNRAEQELRFMRESLDAGVISQEEFEKAERRIRSHIRKLEVQEASDSQEQPSADAPSEELSPQKIKRKVRKESLGGEHGGQAASAESLVEEAGAAEAEERVSQESPLEKETAPEQDDEMGDGKDEDLPSREHESRMEDADRERISNFGTEGSGPELTEEKPAEKTFQEKNQRTKALSAKKDKSPLPQSPSIKKRKEKQEKKPAAEKWGAREEALPDTLSGGTFLRRHGAGIAAAVIAATLLFFVYSFFIQPSFSDKEPILPASSGQGTFCRSDADCSGEGIQGTCTDGSCTIQETPGIKVTILNDRRCGACGTEHMRAVLGELFPGAIFEEADVNEGDTGSLLVEKHSIPALPAYLLGKEASQASSFPKFRRALQKTDDGYLVAPRASGAVFFFRMEEKPLHLDVYGNSLVEAKTKRNLEPFTQKFGGKATVTYHSAGEQDPAAAEFFLSTYPAFVVNNQYKFSGMFPADAIKEKFCGINPLEECREPLPKEVR